MRLGLAQLVALFVLTGAGEATAQERTGATPPRTSSLSWVRLPGAEGCIGTHALASAVEGRLRRTVFVSASAADVSVEGRIEPHSRGWRAVIAISDAHGVLLGERTVESPETTCSALDETVTLVVAVMIDPEAALSPPPAPPPPPREPPPREPPPRVVVRTRRVVVHERAPAEPWRFDLLGRVALAAGFLPDFSPGLSGATVVQPPGFLPIELELALFPAARATAADDTHEVRLDLLIAGALLCGPPLGGKRVRLHACGGLEGGGLWARGVGFETSYSDERVVIQLAGRVRAIVWIYGPFVAQVSATLVVPLRRDRFVAEGVEGTLFEPAPVGGMIDLGAGIRLP